MPALSKKQQKFMGIVRSIQKGEQPASKFNKDAQDVAKDMKKKDVKKFASTKHKGLPMKKEILGKLKEMIKQELSEYTYGVGDVVKDDNPTCPHYGAEGKVKSVNPRSVVFVVTNKGDNFKPGQELEKSHDQMKKIGESVNEAVDWKQAEKLLGKWASGNLRSFNPLFTPVIQGLEAAIKDKNEEDYQYTLKALVKGVKAIGKRTGVRVESTIQEQTVTPINKIKDIKNLVKKDLVSYRGTGAGGNFEISIRNKKVAGYPPSFALLQKDEKKYRDIRSKQFKIKPVAKYFIKGNDLNQLKKFGNVGFLATNRRESVNEMSAKSKKIISKLGKKEKEMFIDMVDMLGFDQVMADYKRDKNAFKQALKDMTEGVITEKMLSVKSSQDFINNLDQAINLIVKQANNLKGPLAKHPIKRDSNKLKAIQTMLKRAILPAMLRYEKENSVEKGYKAVDLTTLKKKLQDGQFKSAIQYSLLPTLDTRSYDSNSFYALNNTKEDKLREKLVKVLRDMTNKMDKAQLENINEDGHTDVASSKRKVMIMVQDSNILLNKLNGMNKEDSLPSWWTDKITLSQNYLAKATDYIINPVESVNESKELDTIEKIVKSTKNFMGVGKALKKVGIKSDFQTSMGLPRYTFKLNGKTYGILNKKSVSKPDRVVGDIAFGVMESINEDGHTDVASSKRKVMIMVDDSNKLLNKLNGMNKEDSLPSWWSDKITLSQNYLQKATNYLLNPVESVNEGKGVEKVLKMANDQSFGKLGGRTVDALSAGLFKGVYDKASDKNKEKINKMNEKQLYVFMTKLWSKFGNQVRIS